MLECIGYESMDQFIESVIPANILEQGKINLGEQKTEEEALLELKQIAEQNKVYKSLVALASHVRLASPCYAASS